MTVPFDAPAHGRRQVVPEINDEWIVAQGTSMDRAIAENQEDLFRRYGSANPFHVAILHSLHWSGHAKYNLRYFDAGLRLLSGTVIVGRVDIERYAWRYKNGSLSAALTTWQKILQRARTVNLGNCAATRISEYQDQLLTAAGPLRQTHELRGVGPWLFCGPFKIILAHRTALWKNQAIDRIRMPLGLEVIRGIRYLRRKRHAEFGTFDLNLLNETEGGLFEGMGTVIMVQDACQRFAERMGTRLLHINSGLYCVGKSTTKEGVSE